MKHNEQRDDLTGKFEEKAGEPVGKAEQAGGIVVIGRLFSRDTITVNCDLTGFGLHAPDPLFVIVMRRDG